MNHHSSIPPVGCPRCDYDLAGIHRESAEAQGRCPECGLDFAWADVLERVPPPGWTLEPDHRVRWDSILDRPARVVLRLLTPSRLWQRPKVEWRPTPSGLMLAHPIRASGLLATAVSGFAFAWLAAALVGGAVGLALHGLEHLESSASSTSVTVFPSGWPPSSLSDTWSRIRASVLVPGLPWTDPNGPGFVGSIFAACVLLVSILMPASLLLLGQTMRTSRVRRRHLWRLVAYALPQLPLLGLLVALPGALGQLAGQLRVTLQAVRVAGNSGVADYAWAADAGDSSLMHTLTTIDWRDWALFIHQKGAVVAFVLAIVWLWSYWRRAATLYLRLPRAELDTAILFATSLLASIVAILSVGVVVSKAMNLGYF